MRISRNTGAIVVGLVGIALVSAAPTVGYSESKAEPKASAAGGDHDKLVLRRDGSKAVPFVPYAGASSSVGEPGGFDWGDATIGAGTALAVMLGTAAVLAATKRRADPRVQTTTVGVEGS